MVIISKLFSKQTDKNCFVPIYAFYHYQLELMKKRWTAAVAHWVRAFALQAERWVFEHQMRQT